MLLNLDMIKYYICITPDNVYKRFTDNKNNVWGKKNKIKIKIWMKSEELSKALFIFEYSTPIHMEAQHLVKTKQNH